LHIHTKASDGLLSPRDVVEYAATETDLNVIAITDHDTLDGAWQAWRWLRAHPAVRLELLWGVEMTAAWFRHLLFYWLDRPPRRLPRRLLPLPRLIAELRETGAVCVAAHPANLLSLAGPEVRALAARGFAPDALEACNPAMGRRREPGVRQLAKELGLGLTGGSDAHGFRATIGAAYTEFPGCSRQHLFAALQEHATGAGWHPTPVHTPLRVLARQIQRAWLTKPGLLQRPREQ